MSGTVWDDDRWTPLPPLHEAIHADVCVVGLGGAGLAAVSELIAHGAKAVGIGAGAIGGGAAGRNAGFLLGGLADFFPTNIVRFGAEIATAIYRQTVAEISRLAADGAAEVRQVGSLRIAATREEVADCQAHGAALRAYGFGAEHYAGPEGNGILVEQDATFHPLRALRSAAGLAIRQGARLFEQTPAVTLHPGEVITPAGRVRCAHTIVAVDGGIERLLPELKPRLRTARLQMLATAPAADVSIPRPVYWRYGYEYWQQLPTGEIALGGFRDHGGEAEWTDNAQPSEAVQHRLENFLRTQVKTAAPITRRWAACVAYTRDRLPVLEPVRERVLAVGAYSGTGNIVSRLCGRAAAQIARGQSSGWARLIDAARTHAARGESPSR